MPVIRMPIDESTLITASVIMSIITFGFSAALGARPGTALLIGAIVGIVLYSLGIVPIGLLAVVGFAMAAGIFRAIWNKL